MINFARKIGTAVAAVVVIGLSAQTSLAVYTSVGPPPSGEDSVGQILSNVYPGTFTLSGVNYLGNAGVNAIRMDDANDQIWGGHFVTYLARARFAGYTQSFGYIPGASGGVYTNIFNLTGYGYAVDEGSFIDPMFTDGSVMRWGRNGDQGGIWSSMQADNPDGHNDHMITYQLTGMTGPNYDGREVFVLFWEDLNLGDHDYNDLVVEVVRIPQLTTNEVPPSGAVPEPLTATMGLLSIGSLALGMTRRRRA